MISFSVIITTYNRLELLKKSVKSVINQNYKNYEIIIINNGLKIDKKFFQLQKKILLINNKKNLHIAKSRNLGAQKAKFNYLAFLDDDDTWPSNYLKKINFFIKKKKYEIFLSKIYIKENGKLKLFKNPKYFNLQTILKFNPGIIGSNIVISKKAFNKIGGFDHELIPSEDKSIIIDAIKKKIKFKTINNYTLYNNSNDNSHIGKNFLLLENGTKNFLVKYSKLMYKATYAWVNFKLNIYKFYNGKFYAIIFAAYYRMLYYFTKN